ncbi:MAG: hypothetical protein QOH72_3660, partial [Solirubrobacteraceae bacterium]|nr:hypothetical protein [Solirubrobacteraceae bacterium]
MEDYQDRLVIATPEGLDVALDLAGLGSRFTAGIIDLAIKVVIYLGYDILFETLGGGRTPGKRATGLRVLRTDGAPEDVVSSLVRHVLRLV